MEDMKEISHDDLLVKMIAILRAMGRENLTGMMVATAITRAWDECMKSSDPEEYAAWNKAVYDIGEALKLQKVIDHVHAQR